METLIAYTFCRDSVVSAAAGRARVEAYYGDLWDHEAKHQGFDGSAVGLHVWDRYDGRCFWPSWRDTGDLRVASLHTPLGYQRVVGDVPPYDAPGRLAQAVRRTPASFLELAPPFTMAVLDPAEERLELFTDSIGVGRLFQLRLADGWVWSNRPVAALLFAGAPAAVSRRTPGGPVRPQQVKPRPLELVERARRWHRYAEGLRPASYLFHAPPKSLTAVDHLAIGGAGGEVAHGHFYPADVLQLDELPLQPKLRAFGNRLQTRLTPTAGPGEPARAAVAEQIERVLLTAVHGGIQNATMLDYFYVVERLRRWGTTGERSGVVSPLLIPAFVRAAFALDPAHRVDNALHSALVRRLVPEWADIPFFKPTAAAPRRAPTRVRCLAEAADRELIEALLTDVEGFDAHALNTLWAASVAGASSAAAEGTLRQALWRATFDQHLAEINDHVPGSGLPLVQLKTAAPVQPKPPTRRLARNRAIRALARTSLWRAFRRSRLGRSWRGLTR